MKNITFSKRIFLVSAALLLLSFAMPTYCTIGDECGGFGAGFIAFFFGITSTLLGGAYVCWFANPLLIVSWFYIKNKPLIASMISAFAFSLGLYFITFGEIIVDESGHKTEITGYAVGYWFWLSSMLSVVLAGIWFYSTRKRSKL